MINNSLKIISHRECYLSEITGVDKCITAHIKKVVSIKELNKKLNWVQFLLMHFKGRCPVSHSLISVFYLHIVGDCSRSRYVYTISLEYNRQMSKQFKPNH